MLYTVDNEFFLGASASQTKNTVATANEGIIARYSKFYSRFYDGIINTGDYFYGNYISTPPDTYTVVFIDGEVAAGTTSSYSGYNYVLFDGTDLDLLFGDKFIIPGSTLNTGSFTNISGTAQGYSQYKYGFTKATRDGVIYPSMDPSIFELKSPNTDINGRVITY